MIPGWIAVVAGALQREDGCWLMHRRLAGTQHGGLWEFPGGKVEPSEMPIESLIRELHEELGITCHSAACQPVAFAEQPRTAVGPAIVILLYTVTGWEGEPAALEGEAVGWFTPEEVFALAKPPLDVVLTKQLLQKR